MVLDSVSSYRMVNLLYQIGQMSEYASDICDLIYKETQTTGKRINYLSQRVAGMEKAMPAIQNTFTSKPSAFFYQPGARTSLAAALCSALGSCSLLMWWVCTWV